MILIFILNMLDIEKMPFLISLTITISMLAGGILFSLYKNYNTTTQ